jgi:hypothetical protein
MYWFIPSFSIDLTNKPASVYILIVAIVDNSLLFYYNKVVNKFISLLSVPTNGNRLTSLKVA